MKADELCESHLRGKVISVGALVFNMTISAIWPKPLLFSTNWKFSELTFRRSSRSSSSSSDFHAGSYTSSPPFLLFSFSNVNSHVHRSSSHRHPGVSPYKGTLKPWRNGRPKNVQGICLKRSFHFELTYPHACFPNVHKIRGDTVT